MALQDIIPVLQGFSGAYATIAATEDPASTHCLEISGVQRGSADIVLEVWQALADNAAPIGATLGLSSVAFAILKKIFGVAKNKNSCRRWSL